MLSSLVIKTLKTSLILFNVCKYIWNLFYYNYFNVQKFVFTGHPAIGAEDGGHSQNKSKGGLKLSLLRLSHHDMAKPQLVLALKELSVGGIMLQSTDSQWR